MDNQNRQAAPASADNPSTAGAKLSSLKKYYVEFNSRAPEAAYLVADVEHLLAAPVAQSTAGAAKPELTVWYGAMPESNGAQNFTATLMRKGASMFDTDSFTFARSEYPDRVRYDADCMRYLIGELSERPDMLAYDADKHSGYASPLAAPALNPSDALRKAVRDITQLLKDGEWADLLHADSDACALWAEVDRLLGAKAAQAAPSAQAEPANLPETTDQARAFLVNWHRKNLRTAPYFGKYISTELAGDFAFHLARWLARNSVAPAPQALADVRDQALEAAALACDFRARNWGSYLDEPEYVARGEAGQICADAIRFMKSRCATKGAVSDSLGQEGGAK